MNSSVIQSLYQVINTSTPILLNPRRKLVNIWCHSSSASHSNNLKTSTRIPAKLERFNEVSPDEVPKVHVLKQKVELLGIVFGSSSVPGLYYNLLCPKCNGGQSIERSLSFHIVPNEDFAMWRCFRFDCGWSGRVFADDRVEDGRTERKFKSARQLTEQALGLLPLGDELIAYFHDRMISEETLHRNNVMQLSGNKLIIAFTYRQSGLLVGCKYRTVEKRFWQEKDTEKVLYGLDDIVDADEIIIVEGELDKLSVEEAGFLNCVSVPGGAPGKVSDQLPSFEKDTAFQYLWNCKQYLDKASRIVLATDGDPPGQALADELARRLGKESFGRSWVWIERLRSRWLNMFPYHGASIILPNKSDYKFRTMSFRISEYQNTDSFGYCLYTIFIMLPFLSGLIDIRLKSVKLNYIVSSNKSIARCWQVSWPKKDDFSYFKDANEVLRCMGPIALKNLIENAELYYQSIADQKKKDI